MFIGPKKITCPLFDFFIDEKDNILILGMKNIYTEDQNKILTDLQIIKNKHLIINQDYFSIHLDSQIYFFNISSYHDLRLESLIVTGYHDFMFAFLDENETIIQ